MSQISVVGMIKAKPEFADNIHKQLHSLIEPTRTHDQGCIQYDLHQDNSDPSLFYFLEIWESEAALQEHMNTDHVQAYIRNSEGMLEDWSTNILSKID